MTASEVEESLPVQTITHETKGLGPNTDPGTFLPWLFHRPPQFGPSVALNSWFTLALQPCSFVSLLRLCISLWFVSLLDHPSRLQLGFALPGLLCSSSYTVPVQHAQEGTAISLGHSFPANARPGLSPWMSNSAINQINPFNKNLSSFIFDSRREGNRPSLIY